MQNNNNLLIAVASANPVKVNAAKQAFALVMQKSLEITSHNIDSGVPDQPMNYEETRLGAQTRVENLIQATKADFYIAYEGGVDVFEDGPKTFAVLCISNGEEMILGQTATLPIPVKVYEKLLAGEELGTAMDNLFNTVNIKQKGGAIGQLTKGLETRESIYQSATILALSRFAHDDLYN
jgi:inosine/xanthosine triphosphatase